MIFAGTELDGAILQTVDGRFTHTTADGFVLAHGSGSFEDPDWRYPRALEPDGLLERREHAHHSD